MDNTTIYNSIMERLEQQKKDSKLTTKLYRYTGLIQAIEYFSQRLNREQILDSAFDFINELLTIEKSALFVMQNQGCTLLKQKGYGNNIKIVADIANLQNLAKMHGTVLYDSKGLEKYLDAETIKKNDVYALLPLIIGGNLYAFILMTRKTIGEIDQDDVIISEALMRLINNALDNHKSYEDLQKSNKELDEKIFNLFAINQSSKVLLSELDLDVLYKLSTDVFSELTQSSITGFVLFDEINDVYELKAYKDIFFNKKDALKLNLRRNYEYSINENRIIIDVMNSSDREYFNNIFLEGINILEPLNALYVVMLVKKQRILGFVSLGKTITGIAHKASEFELIESLASATYIAISNAIYFKQLNDKINKYTTPNYAELFKRDLEKEIAKALETEKKLQVIRVDIHKQFSFKNDALHEKLKSNFEKVYSIAYNIVFIIYSEGDKVGDHNLHRLVGKESAGITYYNLGEDFTGYQNFFNLF